MFSWWWIRCKGIKYNIKWFFKSYFKVWKFMFKWRDWSLVHSVQPFHSPSYRIDYVGTFSNAIEPFGHRWGNFGCFVGRSIDVAAISASMRGFEFGNFGGLYIILKVLITQKRFKCGTSEWHSRHLFVLAANFGTWILKNWSFIFWILNYSLDINFPTLTTLCMAFTVSNTNYELIK